MNAAQAGITAAGAVAAIAGVAKGAAFLASKTAPGTVASRAIGTVAASTGIAPTVTAVVVAYGVARAVSPVRRYVTDRFAGPAADEPAPG